MIRTNKKLSRLPEPFRSTPGYEFVEHDFLTGRSAFVLARASSALSAATDNARQLSNLVQHSSMIKELSMVECLTIRSITTPSYRWTVPTIDALPTMQRWAEFARGTKPVQMRLANVILDDVRHVYLVFLCLDELLIWAPDTAVDIESELGGLLGLALAVTGGEERHDYSGLNVHHKETRG